MRRSTLIVAVSAVSLLVAVIAVIGYLGVQFTHSAPSNDPSQVIYEVKPGQSFNVVAKELEAQGLV
jgi:cell division protein YceG involved in septum cleavage